MIPASWALLRSPRAVLARAHIDKQLSRSPYTHPISINHRARHGTTLSYRHSHSSVGPKETVEKREVEFAIDVLDGQASIRRLAGLLEVGNLDEATTVIGDIVDSVIPADRSLELFRQVKRLLVEAPETNISLMTQLGIGYASRGHATLVKKEIIPFVREFGTPEVLSQFQIDLDTAANHHADLSSNNDVFEESSQDYTSVMAEASPHQPSVMEVVERKLPALLPEHRPDDLSIFEDQSEEYESYIASDARDHSTLLSTGVLANLVSDRKYSQAYSLLQEIQHLEISIPPSHIYEAPAQDALRNDRITPSQRVEHFAAWFSLVPPAHLSATSQKFPEVFRLITQASLTDIILVIRFSLIMASKGYADLVAPRTVSTVFRYSTPEIGQNFVNEFLAANESYWMGYKPWDAPYRCKKTSTNVRGLAIRSLAYSKRTQECLALLPNPNNPEFRLTRYTYDVLLRRLEVSKDPADRKYIPVVESLRNQEATAVVNNHINCDALTVLAEEANMATDLKTTNPVQFGNDLVAALRYLKQSILDKNNLPHPFTLNDFMKSYLATGRTRALQMLLDRAIRTSFRATRAIVFAEMLYYRRMGHPDLVIETFVDHFYLSGVPREEVLSRYNRIRRHRQEYNGLNGERPPPGRFYNFSHDTVLPKGKMWPASAHCNLVFHALVSITLTDQALERLYQKLLYIATEGRDEPDNKFIASIHPLHAPSRWMTISSGAFTPFLRRLMMDSGPERGAKLLSEMVQLGHKPTVYHYTELAGNYARTGNVDKAFLILNQMEERFKKEVAQEVESNVHVDAGRRGRKAKSASLTTPAHSPAAPSRSMSSTTPPNLEPGLPAPDLVMYISLMRGFIISKELPAAQEVARRLQLLHTYRPGEDQYLEDVYADLQKLREELASKARSAHDSDNDFSSYTQPRGNRNRR
ncbi:hypothetical protein B0H34DRAFT_798818 [Crassisporium funariophilum]|nr:hypothetical protein B0H34DRAFT_798818 [Crassisporium funariophilum]